MVTPARNRYMNTQTTKRNQIADSRLLAFTIILALIFTLFIGRLFSIQILNHEEYTDQAEENRISEISIPALRGVIYDRNGLILAHNIPSYDVAILPAALPDDPGEVQKILRQLSEVIGVPINLNEVTPANPYVPCRSEHGISQIVNYGQTSAPFRTVKIKCNIDRATAMIVNEKAVDWPGVEIEIESVRNYPTGSLTASIIGFLGPISEELESYYRERGFLANRDKIGYAGIESYFEELLRGKPGKRVVEVDVAGQVVRDIHPPISPIPGQNITLTIDTRFQEATEAILLGEINEWNAYYGELRITSGVIIAMNPRTGEILSMVSYPTYENNRMARIIPTYYYEQLLADVRDPLLNHAVGAELPAGSVFKVIDRRRRAKRRGSRS